MDTSNDKYSKLVWLNGGLAFLTMLSGLVFYSLIDDKDYQYQLYYAFLLIPILTIGQFFKIYYSFVLKIPSSLFLVSILMIFIYYVPLSDAWTHDTNITYPLSTIVYFVLTIFHVLELIYFSRQNNKTI